ncbi:MAG: NADH:flavin oxidoreductase/NADH oxidase [Alphaproteobacteria bacterium]|nr:NADH:flavin oxidoreductase/NADH oxidase [Alphaproteobacteria bacterium]
MSMPLLFSPISLRDVHLRNRIVISPMCQYSARDGMPDDWHFAHLSNFALGGAGLVFTEASAVVPEGRITHGDTGIWNGEQAESWARIVAFLQSQGAKAGMQLAHAGRKASMQRPWHGNGAPDETDFARGELPWRIVSASAEPTADGWLMPDALEADEIAHLTQAFADAAARCDEAGFDVVEVHGAHGYLLHQFLSPLSNHRTDEYGGSFDKRIRFAIETARAVRAAWPSHKPLFFRTSSVDGIEGGWEIEHTVELAKRLKAEGVDVIDCSSGGHSPKGATNANLARGLGFQVAFADQVRRGADIMTQAVGLILDGPQAEEILQSGSADLIAIGREALQNPFWPHHQRQAMGVDEAYDDWPVQYQWWLQRRARGLKKMGL